jgi:putative ABC transport system permease protein
MNIPLVRGRFFTERDNADAPGVALVDETMARKYWPDQDPIGQHITFEGTQENPKWREVVGIVGHIKHKGLEGESRVQYYIPLDQRPRPDMYLAVQTSAEPSTLAGSVRGVIRGMDPDLPVYRVSTMDRIVEDSLTQRRFAMFLLGIFAFVALALAIVGIYGVMSYMVAQRTNEIGIRMALGARVPDEMKLVIGQGMLPVIIGVGLGLAGAFIATRLMSSLLFGVSATDPVTFAGVSIVLASVALLACAIPARRAARVSPIDALRYE